MIIYNNFCLKIIHYETEFWDTWLFNFVHCCSDILKESTVTILETIANTMKQDECYT